MSSSAETPLSAAQVLQVWGDAFLAAGQRDTHTMLSDVTLSVADRLRQVVTRLNRGRFVLVLDISTAPSTRARGGSSMLSWQRSTIICWGIWWAARG